VQHLEPFLLAWLLFNKKRNLEYIAWTKDRSVSLVAGRALEVPIE
jgi:hypothetical protein